MKWFKYKGEIESKRRMSKNVRIHAQHERTHKQVHMYTLHNPVSAFSGSIPGLVQQSAGTLDLHSRRSRLPWGELVSDGPAGRLADPYGLGHVGGSPHRATRAATSCCATT